MNVCAPFFYIFLPASRIFKASRDKEGPEEDVSLPKTKSSEATSRTVHFVVHVIRYANKQTRSESILSRVFSTVA